MDDHGRFRSLRGVDIGAGGDIVSELVSELEAMNVEVDYDVMRIGPQTWAIHGRIPYDNEVIAATFPSEREAWVALMPLRPGASSGRRRGRFDHR